ncbi:hypothetical protein F0562_032300 [Nyssa sinensis]|uniref:Beta-catenin-like protein 1 N-terminal domain-containing protein n=1 Tax=Nyssa sinensis TaxID=561372 RepID=A0A5J5ASA1_9ASTE|nr:hypothetical protein F0562_032300 [Nyssa sinensis]
MMRLPSGGSSPTSLATTIQSVSVTPPTRCSPTAGVSTIISKPNSVTSDFLSSSLGQWQNHGSNLDRTLILAFKTTAAMSDRAGVVKEKKSNDDKSVDEIATVYNTLENIENLIEVKPSVVEMVCERTKLTRWLLGKIKI